MPLKINALPGPEHTLLGLVVLFVAGGCGDAVPIVESPTNPSGLPIGQTAKPADKDLTDGLTLGLWIQDTSQLSEEVVLAGCGMWTSQHVDCMITDEAHADVHILAGDSDGCPVEDGYAILGETFYQPFTDRFEITINPGCVDFYHPAWFPTHDQDMFVHKRNLVSHELGHAFGIWPHVPSGCEAGEQDAREIDDVNGVPICGNALMNVLTQPDLPALTDVDLRAFAVRKDNGVFPHIDAARLGVVEEGLVSKAYVEVTDRTITCRVPLPQ